MTFVKRVQAVTAPGPLTYLTPMKTQSGKWLCSHPADDTAEAERTGSVSMNTASIKPTGQHTVLRAACAWMRTEGVFTPNHECQPSTGSGAIAGPQTVSVEGLGSQEMTRS